MDAFLAAFYNAVKLEDTAEFEKAWSDLLRDFNMESNSRLANLYELREYWCPVFLRDQFFADMTTTQRSESINSFLNGFFTASTSLIQFVQKFDEALEARSRKQVEAGMRSKYLGAIGLTGSPLEVEAAAIPTPYAYRKAQEQIALSQEYICKPSTAGKVYEVPY